MKIEELPVGNAPDALGFPHFPTRFQAVIWRNWEMAEPARLAEILACSEKDILDAASEMGLPCPPAVQPKWGTHGYLTLIRNNWHLLGYEQLLQLLDWSPDKLALTLKEEDFMWGKMGGHKPACGTVRFSPLTPEQKAATAFLRQSVLKHFPDPSHLRYQNAPFSFSGIRKTNGFQKGEAKFKFNFIHSYAASCGDILLDMGQNDPLPEELLAQYQSMGINGIWFHAVLYLLHPVAGSEEYSGNYRKRLENLAVLVERAARHGIKLYLYLNEPRYMPYAFYEKNPDWAGIDIPRIKGRTNCITRSDSVLRWLEDATAEIFRKTPGLGGVNLINMSENATHCNYHWDKAQCPYCKEADGAVLIARIINAVERGVHASAPEARVMAMDWVWWEDLENNEERNFAFKTRVIDLLPKSVAVISVSEHGLKTCAGGIPGHVQDYSISQVGPGGEALRTWDYLKKHGHEAIAKIQVNNSWELSALPYVPVPYLIEEHLNRLSSANVDGLMLSWTLGGYPGGNLELLNKTVEEISNEKFNPAAAEKIREVWRQCGEAYREYPFDVLVSYLSPVNFGPKSLLHIEKTHYPATMIGFPYDDLERWRSIYPPEIFISQFEKMADGWKKALDRLIAARPLIRNNEREEYEEIRLLITAGWCHLQSTASQARFVMNRDMDSSKEVLAQIVREELETALKLHETARLDPRIGFEPSNHSYYTLNDLREKIANCEYLLASGLNVCER